MSDINNKEQEGSYGKPAFPKKHIIYPVIILLLLAGCAFGYFYAYDSFDMAYKQAYDEAVIRQTAECDSIIQEYANASEDLYKKQQKWERLIKVKQSEAAKAKKELEDLLKSEEREAKEEARRFELLSEEKKRLELMTKYYNEMVDTLRITNPEYEDLYTSYAVYLTLAASELSKEDMDEYMNMYERKTAIEQDYIAAHPFSE